VGHASADQPDHHRRGQELFAALQAARRSLDDEERAEHYAEAQKIIWENAAGIYPMDQVNNSAWNSRIQDYVLSPTDTPSFAQMTLAE
jgi:peptide/nickel transport system substrate-binding protein